MSSERSENAALTTSMRLDKWLWSARIFKTRALATAAVAGGKVHLNGTRVKPAHAVRAGDTLTVQRGYDAMTIAVRSLATHRGPAPVATKLYDETDASRAARAERAAARAALASSPRGDTRPTKKQRRDLIRLTRKGSF